jgi:sec-independent protein translocase protein TatB
MMGSLDPAKLLMILVIALVVLGPERLPKVARQIGGTWHELQKLREKAESEIRSAMPDLSDLPRLPTSPTSSLSGFLSDLTSPKATGTAAATAAAAAGVASASSTGGAVTAGEDSLGGAQAVGQQGADGAGSLSIREGALTPSVRQMLGGSAAPLRIAAAAPAGENRSGVVLRGIVPDSADLVDDPSMN